MSKNIFNWNSNESKDDFTCNVEGFCLRTEAMQNDVWWWCVYSPDGEQSISSYTNGEWCKTLDEARDKAEKGYLSLSEIKVK